MHANHSRCIVHETFFSAMKLVIMTRPQYFVEEDKILEALFEEGLDDLHLFKPGESPIYAERLLTLLPEDCHRKITVHDHFYLKEEFGLGGIHLDSMSQEKPERYKGKISRSCQLSDDLRQAKKKSRYIFLKSIFDGVSNPDETPAYDMDTLRAASRQGLIDKNVYAFGGVTLENAQIARSLGFGGIVVCGDLWNRFDIHNELDFKAIIGHFNKLREAIE